LPQHQEHKKTIGIALKVFALRTRFLLCVSLVLCVGFVSGCSDSTPKYEGRALVSGTVTFKGKTLPGGSVTMTSKSNPSLIGLAPIREDGSFAFADAPLGPVNVGIITESMKIGNPSKYVEIPSSYGDPATSGLSYEVKEGENTDVKFDLK
jgi:hypothetical protein